jgi:uncharacterized protein YabN with tetrapyrrole methylase and pyrophosphatase domain
MPDKTITPSKSISLRKPMKYWMPLKTDPLRKPAENWGTCCFKFSFLAILGEEKGDFDFLKVVREITAKMIRRHPHVFSDTKVSSAEEVAANWARIKRQEADTPEMVSSALKNMCPMDYRPF